MIKPIALTFAVAMTLAPVAAHATYSSAAGTPAPGQSGYFQPHHYRHRSPPILGQEPRPRAHLPAISRNPEDCVKTMCTCLAGGGC
jgi:hypothetical protein